MNPFKQKTPNSVSKNTATVILVMFLLFDVSSSYLQTTRMTESDEVNTNNRHRFALDDSKNEGSEVNIVKDVRADSRQSRICARDIRTDFKEIRTELNYKEPVERLDRTDSRNRNNFADNTLASKITRDSRNSREENKNRLHLELNLFRRNVERDSQTFLRSQGIEQRTQERTSRQNSRESRNTRPDIRDIETKREDRERTVNNRDYDLNIRRNLGESIVRESTRTSRKPPQNIQDHLRHVRESDINTRAFNLGSDKRQLASNLRESSNRLTETENRRSTSNLFEEVRSFEMPTNSDSRDSRQSTENNDQSRTRYSARNQNIEERLVDVSRFNSDARDYRRSDDQSSTRDSANNQNIREHLDELRLNSDARDSRRTIETNDQSRTRDSAENQNLEERLNDSRLNSDTRVFRRSVETDDGSRARDSTRNQNLRERVKDSGLNSDERVFSRSIETNDQSGASDSNNKQTLREPPDESRFSSQERASRRSFKPNDRIRARNSANNQNLRERLNDVRLTSDENVSRQSVERNDRTRARDSTNNQDLRERLNDSKRNSDRYISGRSVEKNDRTRGRASENKQNLRELLIDLQFDTRREESSESTRNLPDAEFKETTVRENLKEPDARNYRLKEHFRQPTDLRESRNNQIQPRESAPVSRNRQPETEDLRVIRDTPFESRQLRTREDRIASRQFQSHDLANNNIRTNIKKLTRFLDRSTRDLRSSDYFVQEISQRQDHRSGDRQISEKSRDIRITPTERIVKVYDDISTLIQDKYLKDENNNQVRYVLNPEKTRTARDIIFERHMENLEKLQARKERSLTQNMARETGPMVEKAGDYTNGLANTLQIILVGLLAWQGWKSTSKTQKLGCGQWFSFAKVKSE